MQDFWNDTDWASMAGKVGMALIILLITWVVARAAIWIFGKVTRSIPALQRAGSDGQTLGTIASLLIWMFGLIAVLQVFNLDEVLAPIQELLNGVMNFLPNIIGAVFLFIVGALLAKIVRQLIETALSTIPFQKWFGQAGGEELTGNTNIARTLAMIVYALIMIVVSIAALQILGISSISDPASQMLQTIFNAIPNVIAAGLMLGLGVVIARFGAGILGDLLDGLGTDRALRELDVLEEGKSAVPAITRVAQVAIVLFFAVMAAQLLNFPAITRFLTAVLELGGRVLFGGAIIAAGFFLANMLAKLFAGTAARVVFYATVALFVAMGLSFMGIASSIVQLAFGAIVVGAAAAAALAFGLGGRDEAARLLARTHNRNNDGI